jgi:NAD(P)-dependent dehydrogenase (short-subunit alcohol dehydrogenase family)
MRREHVAEIGSRGRKEPRYVRPLVGRTALRLARPHRRPLRDFRKTLESQTPLGRIGQTEDIAPAAVFFASSDSKWITGETLLIAGGLR